MNDEKFEKILQESLTPDVSDADIMVSHKPRNTRKMITRITAACACAALVATIGVRDYDFRKTNQITSSAVSTQDNSFTILANAQEIASEKGASDNGATIKEDLSRSVAIFSDQKRSYYEFALPLMCKGKNVSSVKYTANNGAFHMGDLKEVNVNLNGDKKTTTLPIDEADITEDMISKDGKTNEFFRSYTVDYNKEINSKEINLCGFANLTLADSDGYYHSDDPYSQVEFLNKVLNDAYISYTVTFKDGTTAKGKITVQAKVDTSDTPTSVIVVKGKN